MQYIQNLSPVAWILLMVGYICVEWVGQVVQKFHSDVYCDVFDC